MKFEHVADYGLFVILKDCIVEAREFLKSMDNNYIRNIDKSSGTIFNYEETKPIFATLFREWEYTIRHEMAYEYESLSKKERAQISEMVAEFKVLVHQVADKPTYDHFREYINQSFLGKLTRKGKQKEEKYPVPCLDIFDGNTNWKKELDFSSLYYLLNSPECMLNA
jgi:hypothetical protein